MADGYLNFDTQINTNGFNKGISAIGSMASKAGSSITKNVTKPAMVAATALASMTLAKGWSRMTALDNAKVKLKAIGNSAEDVTAIMTDALASVKGTAYGMDEAATTAASAVAAGIKPGQQLEGYLTAVADAASVAGIDMASMGAIFNKVATQGEANNEVLQQMAEAGIPIYQYLADQIGCTAGEVFDMASKGEIDLATFQKAVETHIGGAAKTIGSSTISGAISNIMASISRISSNFLGSADDAESFAGKVLPLLNSVTDALGIVEGKASELGEKFGAAFAPLAEKIMGVCDSFAFMDEAAQNSAIEAAASGAAMVVGLGPALEIFGKIIKGSDAVGVAVGKMPGSVKGAVNGFRSNLSDAAKSFGNLKDAILLPLDGLKPGMTNIINGIAETWREAPGGKITSAVSNTVSKISDTFGKIGPALQNKFPKISGALSNLTSYMGTWGSLVGESFQGVLKTVGNFAPGFINLLKFGAIAGVLVAGFGLLQGQFGDQITSLLQIVSEKGPEIITNLCNGITGRLPELIAQGSTLIQNLLQAITANIPAIITGGIQIISGLVTGIAQQLPALIPTALQMILTIIQSLLQNIPQLISAGLQLIMGLAQGLVNSIPVLIAALPQIIQALVSGISQTLPTIILTGIQLLIALVTGIIQAIPQLLAAIPDIFKAFVDGVMSVDWSDVGKQILTAITDGIKSIGSNLWGAVKDIFSDGESDAEKSGKNTGKRYAQGIESTKGNAQDSADEVANATTNSFASTLDANGTTVNLAAMNMGNNASNGLELANVPGAFSLNAQVAADGLSSTLGMNNMNASSAALALGSSANSGISLANMGSTFTDSGTQAGQGLGTGLSSATGTVSGAASSLASSAQYGISKTSMVASYTQAGQSSVQALAMAIISGSSSVNGATNTVANGASNTLSSAKLSNKARQEGQNMYKSLANAIKSGTGTVRTAVTTLMNAAKTAANGLGTAGTSAGKKFSTGIADGIKSGQSGVSSAAIQVASAAKAAVRGMESSGYSAGQMFSAGLANGIRAGQYGVASAAAQIANAAVRAAQANLDINSPSRVGEWLGRMFDYGIAGGIAGGIKLVSNSVGKMTDTIEEGTAVALNSLQKQAVKGVSATSDRIYPAAASELYSREKDTSGLLDEWERRQKKINRERDERPILIDGRRVNRTPVGKMGGVVTV